MLKEHKLAGSGLTEADALKAGRLLNANFILLGELIRVGRDVTANVKLVDVETGENIGSRSIACKNFSLGFLYDMIKLLAPTVAKCIKR